MNSISTPPRSTAPNAEPNAASTTEPKPALAVPLLDLHRQYQTIREEVLAAIERVCDSQSFILGPEVEAFEHEIAALTGAASAVGCSSGTEALWLALVAAGVKPGDSVITTAFSFFASASAIVRAGATPIFVDVDPATLNLDPTLVGQFLRDQRRPRTQTKNVRAILPVHLYGQCADMDGFDRIIKEHNKEHANDHSDHHAPSRLVLVEDAAQAIGAEWSGRPAGSLGITAAFSFYPTKNLSAYGEAGIVTTSSPQMAERMRQLRSHGSPRRYYHNELGWNGRMDAIQATVLRVKLAHLPEWTRQRQQHAATYDRLFAASGLISVSPAQEISPHASPDSRPISQPISQPGSHQISQPGSNERSAPTDAPVRQLARSPQATHVFHQYVIRAQRRDDLRKFLADRNIGSEVYYPLPLHLQPAFSYLGLKAGDMPVSEQAAQEVLALPMFPELTEIEIRHVVESIADFYS